MRGSINIDGMSSLYSSPPTASSQQLSFALQSSLCCPSELQRQIICVELAHASTLMQHRAVGRDHFLDGLLQASRCVVLLSADFERLQQLTHLKQVEKVPTKLSLLPR